MEQKASKSSILLDEIKDLMKKKKFENFSFKFILIIYEVYLSQP